MANREEDGEIEEDGETEDGETEDGETEDGETEDGETEDGEIEEDGETEEDKKFKVKFYEGEKADLDYKLERIKTYMTKLKPTKREAMEVVLASYLEQRNTPAIHFLRRVATLMCKMRDGELSQELCDCEKKVKFPHSNCEVYGIYLQKLEEGIEQDKFEGMLLGTLPQSIYTRAQDYMFS